MLGLLSLAITIAAVAGGFVVARDFVVRRLRFVDGVRSPLAPWIAGIGAALIEHGIAMAERAGQQCFLETGNPRNVAYYERFGFEVVSEGDGPDGGPHVWFILRP